MSRIGAYYKGKKCRLINIKNIKWNKNTGYFILIIVVFFGLFLRLYNLNMRPIGSFWDDAYYVKVIQNIYNEPHNFLYPLYINGPDIHYYDSIFPAGRILINKPPAFFWLGTLFTKIFGLKETGLRLVSVFFGTMTIFLVYSLGNLLHGRKIAILAAFLLATYPLHIMLSNAVLLEATTTAYTILIVYMLIRGIMEEKKLFLIASSIFIALSLLTKGFEMLPIVGVYLGLCVTQWQRRRKYLYFGFAMFVIGILLYLIWPFILWLTPKKYDGFLWCQEKNVWSMLFKFNLLNRINIKINFIQRLNAFFQNHLDVVIPTVFIFIMATILLLRPRPYKDEKRRNSDTTLLLYFSFYFVPFLLFYKTEWRLLAPLYPIYTIISAAVFITVYEKIKIKTLRIGLAVFIIAFFSIRPFFLFYPKFSFLTKGYPVVDRHKDYKIIGGYIKDKINGYKFSAIVDNSPLMSYYTGKFAVSFHYLHKPVEEYLLTKESRFVEIVDWLEKDTLDWIKKHCKLIDNDIGTFKDNSHHLYDCIAE